MTRDFDKQRRDDSRPSFRNNSSNRYGEERSSNPARPRLNREMVDRAWENGSPRQHADYRPRRNGNAGPPPQNNWRKNQYGESSSSYNSGGNRSYDNSGGNRGHDNSGGNRSYGNRQDNYRPNNGQRFERPAPGNPGPRPRPYEANRYNDGDQRSGKRRGYGDEPYRSNSQQNFHPGGQAQERPARDFGRGQPPPRDFGRGQERPPRDFGRGQPPPRRNDFRGRTDQEEDRPPHPREQSRPAAFREQIDHRDAREERRSRRYTERYEGDYEHFSADNAPQRPALPPERKFQGKRQERDGHEQEQERHVTRLPDGRVLKGSRPEQRKKAQFWNGVSEETDELVDRLHTPTREDGTRTQAEGIAEETGQENEEVSSQGLQPAGQDAPAKKPAKRIASAVRRKKADAAPKARSKGPRPSQRGFKWPTSTSQDETV